MQIASRMLTWLDVWRVSAWRLGFVVATALMILPAGARPARRSSFATAPMKARVALARRLQEVPELRVRAQGES